MNNINEIKRPRANIAHVYLLYFLVFWSYCMFEYHYYYVTFEVCYFSVAGRCLNYPAIKQIYY